MVPIKHITTVPYHPSPIGSVERAVQTFRISVKKKISETAKDNLAAELLFNQRIKLRLSLVKPHITTI